MIQNNKWLLPEAYFQPVAFTTSPNFRTVKAHAKLKYQNVILYYVGLKDISANLFPSFFFFSSCIFGYQIFSVTFIYKT